MRLICPNCGAQYEVADDVIPDGGRDVQCSNCGHAWLENPGASAFEEDELAAEPISAEQDDNWDAEHPSDTADESDSSAHDAPEPDTPAAPDEPPLDDDKAVDQDAPETAPVAAPAPQRRPLDQSVAEILRQEAAHEEAQRSAATSDGLESQSELGLTEGTTLPDQRAEETRRRMAVLKGEDPVKAAVAATVAASATRRELLPDIEEINSSLRSSAERGEDPVSEPQEADVENRRGFRFGFTTMVLLLAVLALIYIFAPQIAQMVPAAEPALTGYVDAVDAARLWLDIKVGALLDNMQGTSAAE